MWSEGCKDKKVKEEENLAALSSLSNSFEGSDGHKEDGKLSN